MAGAREAGLVLLAIGIARGIIGINWLVVRKRCPVPAVQWRKFNSASTHPILGLPRTRSHSSNLYRRAPVFAVIRYGKKGSGL